MIHHFQPMKKVGGGIYEARSVQCSRMFKGCMAAGNIESSEAEARAAWNRRSQANATLSHEEGGKEQL